MTNKHEQKALYSLADMARHFALPESSIRYYCKRFETFIPSSGQGRQRRFTYEALEIIQTIIEEMPRLRTAKAVEAELQKRYPQNVTVTSLQDIKKSTSKHEGQASQSAQNALATQKQPYQAVTHELATPMRLDNDLNPLSQIAIRLLDRQTQILDNMAVTLDSMQSRQQQMDKLLERAQNAEEEAAGLRKELSSIKSLINGNEQIHQADLEQIRSWVGKILKQTTEKKE